MPMKLDGVVPFGRSLEEYRDMFALTRADMDGTVLGVGDGPASFNAESCQFGASVVSVDPLYHFSGEVIRQRFNEVVDEIIKQVRHSPDDWVWNWHDSPDSLRQTRVRALETFLDDYPWGLKEGRYVIGELPLLPFTEHSFDLALCSHLLFLYSAIFSEEFHYHSILEMLRIANEVRIFPLITLGLERAPCLDNVMAALSRDGYNTTIRRVNYELQQGGNEMMIVRRKYG